MSIPDHSNSLRLEILKFAGLIYRIAAFDEWIGEKEFTHTARFIEDKLFQRWVKKNNSISRRELIKIIMNDIKSKYNEIQNISGSNFKYDS